MWWEAVIAFFGKLFGGKSAIQIGKDQQSFTASSTGQNSPVVNAGRDVNFHSPPAAQSQAEKEAELLAEMNELMPEIIEAIREGLAEDPLVRKVVAHERASIVYNCGEPHLRFSNDAIPDACRKIEILSSHQLLRMNKPSFYEISPKLVRILKANPE